MFSIEFPISPPIGKNAAMSIARTIDIYQLASHRVFDPLLTAVGAKMRLLSCIPMLVVLCSVAMSEPIPLLIVGHKCLAKVV